LVTLHLLVDDPQVDLCSLLGHRPKGGKVPPDAFEQSPLELEEVGVDAHPVSSVLPMGGLEVLALEGAGNACLRRNCHFRQILCSYCSFTQRKKEQSAGGIIAELLM